jgi:hypothetical protein
MKTKALKRAEAIERQAAYDALSLEEKLARALRRGSNHSREYYRLLDKIVREKAA